MKLNIALQSGAISRICLSFVIYFSLLFAIQGTANSQTAGLRESGLYVIPYPQQATINTGAFLLNNTVNIILDKNHSSADAFAAEELIRDLKKEWNITAIVSSEKKPGSIILSRNKKQSGIKEQGYQLTATATEIKITAKDEAGLFYGTQTLLQLIKKNEKGISIPGLSINDWPAIPERAIHYDTKHHQDKLSYVKDFIKELARYKVNMLVWEWEDKFAYPSHPEIGAPGAFTVDEIKGLTKYARDYHIEIAPLVQGLGHVSFILKWPQYNSLREIPASNWEFCPLKDSSYNLLFDLWKDAMDATGGSKYFHIGSDETYELGLCEKCQAKAKEIGKNGLYHLFGDKASKFIVSQGRKPMMWETSAGLVKTYNEKKFTPNKNIVLTEDMGEVGVEEVKKAKKLGHKVFYYDPNPGTEPLFLPYFYSENEQREKLKGCLEKSYIVLKEAAGSGVFDGVIRTSWDDGGLHNQAWMLCFLTTAEYAWNSEGPDLNQFKETFFSNYYGTGSKSMEELFGLLNEAAYYYWDTFERKVWHFGEIGKTFLPDLPRGDAIEYDPYWNTQNKAMVERSREMLVKMDKAKAIIEANQKADVKHAYDFEIFETLTAMTKHTSQVYLDLSSLEYSIKAAHNQTFLSRDSAVYFLENAQRIISDNLKRRKQVLDNLTAVWEKTRLPKGLSTADKQYFFRQDRARHLANRRPDMSFLVYDEEQLGLEDYLEKLKAYTEQFRKDSF